MIMEDGVIHENEKMFIEELAQEIGIQFEKLNIDKFLSIITNKDRREEIKNDLIEKIKESSAPEINKHWLIIHMYWIAFSDNDFHIDEQKSLEDLCHSLDITQNVKEQLFNIADVFIPENSYDMNINTIPKNVDELLGKGTYKQLESIIK